MSEAHEKNDFLVVPGASHQQLQMVNFQDVIWLTQRTCEDLENARPSLTLALSRTFTHSPALSWLEAIL